MNRLAILAASGHGKLADITELYGWRDVVFYDSAIGMEAW